MPNEQLLGYIREQLGSGVDRGQLTQDLVKAGWPVSAITEAFNALDGSTAATVTAAPPPPPSGDLPGATALLREGFRTYGRNYKTLIEIGFIQMLPGILLTVIGLIIAHFDIATTLLNSLPLIPLIVIFVLFFLIVAIGVVFIAQWGVAAMMQTIRASDEHITSAEAFRRARPYIFSFLWVSILVGLSLTGAMFISTLPTLAVSGGLFFFFASSTNKLLATLIIVLIFLLLFVALLTAAFIVGTWLQFSTWLVLETDVRGMQALVESRRLTRTDFWRIVGRSVVIGLYLLLLLLPFIIVIICVEVFLPRASVAASFLQQGTQVLLVFPLLMGAMFPLYTSLKGRAPTSPTPAKGRGVLITLALVGLIGLVLLPLAGGILASLLTVSRTKGHDALRKMNISVLRAELELHADANGTYPIHLIDMSTAVLPSSITDPVTKQPFSYTSDGSTYSLCATLSTKEEHCVKSENALQITDVGADPAFTTQTTSLLRFAEDSYVDTTRGFKFDTPADWAVQGTGDPSNNQGLVFMRPTRDVAGVRGEEPVLYAATVSLWITPPSFEVSPQAELDSYVTSKKAKLKKDLPTFKILNESNVTVDSAPGKRFTATWQFDDGATVTMLQMNTVKNRQIYELALIAASEKWSEYEPFFMHLVDSFAFFSGDNDRL